MDKTIPVCLLMLCPTPSLVVMNNLGPLQQLEDGTKEINGCLLIFSKNDSMHPGSGSYRCSPSDGCCAARDRPLNLPVLRLNLLKVLILHWNSSSTSESSFILNHISAAVSTQSCTLFMKRSVSVPCRLASFANTFSVDTFHQNTSNQPLAWLHSLTVYLYASLCLHMYLCMYYLCECECV